MRILDTLRLSAYVLIAFISVNTSLQAQRYALQKSTSQMEVLGTSNIHDWELTVEDIAGSMQVTETNNKLEGISKLHLAILAESLKSGKSGMDKNTFKALNTSAYKNLEYDLKKVESIKAKEDGNYVIQTTGYLMIAGVTKQVSIVFDANVMPGYITLTGNHVLNMTHYKIDPPKALFGTITTGEMVTVKYKTTFIN